MTLGSALSESLSTCQRPTRNQRVSEHGVQNIRGCVEECAPLPRPDMIVDVVGVRVLDEKADEEGKRERDSGRSSVFMGIQFADCFDSQIPGLKSDALSNIPK